MDPRRRFRRGGGRAAPDRLGKVEVRVALDTNRLTDLMRGDTELADLLGTCEEVWIPLFVLAEIKAGFSGGNQRHRNEMILQRFLAKKTVDVLLPGRETAEQWADRKSTRL